MYKSFIHPLGNSFFISWDHMDNVFYDWGQNYFGEHVTSVCERDGNECHIVINGLRYGDFAKFAALYETHDIDRDFEPEADFAVGAYNAHLPSCITRGVMSELINAPSMDNIGSLVANEMGVYVMEYERESSPGITCIMAPEYAALSQTKDFEYLIDNMNKSSLSTLEKTIRAYNLSKIDLEYSRNEDGEVDFDSFEVAVIDEAYVSKELADVSDELKLLALKWYESFEDTGYLIDCFNSDLFTNKSIAKTEVSFSSVLNSSIGQEIDAYFKEKGWKLELWDTGRDIGFQVYFGKHVQVDNHFEYGFEYLYDKDELTGFATNFYESKIKKPSLSEQISNASEKSSSNQNQQSRNNLRKIEPTIE